MSLNRCVTGYQTNCFAIGHVFLVFIVQDDTFCNRFAKRSLPMSADFCKVNY